MNENRRAFLKRTAFLSGLTTLVGKSGFARWKEMAKTIPEGDGEIIKILTEKKGTAYKPLQELTIDAGSNGTISVMDGYGRKYFTASAQNKLHFLVGGALGTHVILLKSRQGRLLDVVSFRMDCKTEIQDKKGEFSKLFEMLYYTMNTGHTTAHHRWNAKTYTTFAGWFQDHVHVFKAMKYFYPDVKRGIDLFAEGQREDGMIYDNYYQPYNIYTSWLSRFGEKFVKVPDNPKINSSFFVRIPVENMGEFTFLEGVYYVWKATGDDDWMADKLDHCIKAIEYSTSDAYRWSKKFKLLKRGYTIDIWDFLPTQDAAQFGGDIMMAHPEKTKFSVMYGDNIGLAVGCDYVAEMLEYVRRSKEAKRIKAIGESIRKRTDELCWNGEFYTHHIPEDPGYKRDFGGTDESKQVTISNSYAINRRIGHEKAVAIIETYQRIAKEMPKSSPGEWYICYPPFEKGWHLEKWEYMNGGVSSIVAGEVAHGAFEHGFEEYGVYILRRMWELAQLTGNRLECIYRGAMPAKPKRKFIPLSLKNIANADTSGRGAAGVPGWTGQGDNDLHEFPVGRQVFEDVPFDFVDPAKNGRKACLIISGDKRYDLKKQMQVNQKAASIYIVHAQSYGNHVGNITLRYEDNTTYVKYITRGENIHGWWYPQNSPYDHGKYAYKVAWTGKNKKCIDVGIYIYGFDNPYKRKRIETIEFNGIKSDAKWMILGITLCDKPVFFMPEVRSFGAPDNWGAAAVVYALMEGLAGIKDTGVAFDKALLAPRWEAAAVNEVSATAKYEASGGYLSYRYRQPDEKYEITFTGTSPFTEINVFIPVNKKITEIRLNGKQIDYQIKMIEKSKYVCLLVKGVGVHKLEIA